MYMEELDEWSTAYKSDIIHSMSTGGTTSLLDSLPAWQVDVSMLTESILRSMRPYAMQALADVKDPNVFRRYVEMNQYLPPHMEAFSYSLKGKPKSGLWFPGTYIGHSEYKNYGSVSYYYGPRVHTDVMLIGSYPTEIDCGNREPFSGFYREVLESKIGDQIEEAYFTYLVKFDAGITTSLIPKHYREDCMPWLDHELSVIQPKFIVCFGVDVAKALTGDNSLTQDAAIGRLYDFEYKGLNSKLVVVPKLQVMCNNRDSQRYIEIFEGQLQRVGGILRDPSSLDPATEGHIVIRDDKQLKAEVDRIIELAKKDPKRRIIALDMEWEGAYPEQPGAHLLTVQFSSAPGEASVVVLKSSDPNGKVVSKNAAKKQLTRLLCYHDDWHPRLGGHFLRADLPWLQSLLGTSSEDGSFYGPEISYAACKEFKDVKDEGGWDTSLMFHAYDEDATYGLKHLAKHLLGLPAWEAPLQEYLAEYRSHNKLRMKDITGYGCIPDEILHPYGAWDVDATRQLAELLMFGYKGHKALLDEDPYGNDCWYPFWMAHRAALGFLEIEQTGFVLDRPRFAELCDTFQEVSDALLANFRDRMNWPEFTPSKILHKRGVLFGHEYAIPPGKDISVMPQEAISLRCTPEYDTKDKRPWSDEDAEDKDPASDKTTLNILARKHPEVGLLRDIGIVQRALSSPLSNIEHYWDTKGEHKLFPKGLYAAVREDGRVHTRMSQLMVTGRASSSSPNLQNLGKSAEAAYQRILGTEKDGEASGDYLDILGRPRYIRPLRSVLRAPKDYVLIESDFTGAELAVMAWASKDPNMIDQVRRNALPEDDPDFYDIHSHVAVKAFRLDCEPTKKGLAAIGKKHLRIAAKAVVFGIPF